MARPISVIMPGSLWPQLLEQPLEERPAAIEEDDRREAELDVAIAWETQGLPQTQDILDHGRQDDDGERQNQRYPEPAPEIRHHVSMVPCMAPCVGGMGLMAAVPFMSHGFAALGLELPFAAVTAEVVDLAVLLQRDGPALVHHHPANRVLDFLGHDVPSRSNAGLQIFPPLVRLRRLLSLPLRLRLPLRLLHHSTVHWAVLHHLLRHLVHPAPVNVDVRFPDLIELTIVLGQLAGNSYNHAAVSGGGDGLVHHGSARRTRHSALLHHSTARHAALPLHHTAAHHAALRAAALLHHPTAHAPARPALLRLVRRAVPAARKWCTFQDRQPESTLLELSTVSFWHLPFSSSPEIGSYRSGGSAPW